jgi:hypothetical protein
MIDINPLEIKPRCDFNSPEEPTVLSSSACENRYESMVNTLLPTGYRVAYVKRNEMHDEHFYIYAVAKSFSHTMEVTFVINRLNGEVELWKYSAVPLVSAVLEAAA